MYRIAYQNGEIFFQISRTAAGCVTQLTDVRNNIDTLITGDNENDLYDKCCRWASSNIRGEFVIEPTEVRERLSVDVAA